MINMYISLPWDTRVTAVNVVYARKAPCTWTDSYRNLFKALQCDHQMVYKVMGGGGGGGEVTAIWTFYSVTLHYFLLVCIQTLTHTVWALMTGPRAAVAGWDAAKLPRLPGEIVFIIMEPILDSNRESSKIELEEKAF